MGKRREQLQENMWVAMQDLTGSASHSFYKSMNRVFDKAGLDGYVEKLCARFYAPRMGRTHTEL
jgi:hypothetical protein